MMADHLRKQIRDATREALLGLYTTGPNVHVSRRKPFVSGDQIPALCIYTLAEESGAETMGPARRLQRMLDLVVEIVVAANDDMDDLIDRIALEVETAMQTTGKGLVWGRSEGSEGLAYDATLVRTAVGLHPDQQPAYATGFGMLVYRVAYRSAAADPSTK